MPNDLLVTTTDILGIEVAKDYSGASGIYVDNVNNIISITGDVGKEYNGIEPIVVNNEENLISANSAPIGVQEPLYFVQDDDEAVVIGLSGEYVTPSDIAGKMDTSSFESWQQGQYTNDLTAINEKINEVSSNIPSLEGYATEQWVEDKGYLTEVSIPESATWNETTDTLQSNSGTWNTVSDKLDTTAQVISSCETSSIDGETLVTKLNGNEIAVEYAGSARIANIALKDYQGNSFVPFYAKTSALEEKLDTTAFSTVSGDFLTAVDLSNYYTKDETSGKEELAQAFANLPGGDTEVNAYVHNNSASIDGTTDVVQSNSSVWSDITAYQSNSASYLTAHQSLDGYATETFVQDTSANITALIPDTSNFITNASAESTYQTIAGMTAYQPVGSYATTNELEQVSADITATIPSTAGLASESYVQTNSAVLTGMIDGKQDTLTFGYDEQDRINSINSSALAGGTDLEFGYTDADTISSINTSALTDVSLNNIVQTNSGVWGGSALPISAGPGIKVNLVDNTLVFSNDETLLYSATGGNSNSITLNETPLNFNELKIYTRGINWGEGTANKCNDNYFVDYSQFSTNYLAFQGVLQGNATTGNQYFVGANYSGTSGTTWTRFLSYTKNLNATGNADWANTGFMSIYKVIGVGRRI